MSRDTAAHDEGEHYSDGDYRNHGKYDADNYEHREPPKFSHNHLLDSVLTVRDGCFIEFFGTGASFNFGGGHLPLYSHCEIGRFCLETLKKPR